MYYVLHFLAKQMSDAKLSVMARYQWPTAEHTAIVGYFVPGLPVPQGDLQANRQGRLFHKSKALAPWRHEVGWRARKAMRTNGFANVLFGGPVAMNLYFTLHRPVNASKRKPTEPAVKKPDLDKLTRAILDSLTDVVYVDDSQVIEIHTYKRTAEVEGKTGVRIEVNRVVRLGDWEDGDNH